MTSGAAKGKFSKHAISTLLVGLFFLQLFAPLASASGMASCSGDCDNYDHDEDMTPHQQDWVEGVYDFEILSTSSIQLQLSWAVREFDREALGFGSESAVGSTLESTDGLDENDGVPADLIREYFDTTLPSANQNVGQKLKGEVHTLSLIHI